MHQASSLLRGLARAVFAGGVLVSATVSSGCIDDESRLGFDDPADALADGATTHAARFEIQLSDAPPIVASGRLTVTPGAAGRPDEAYFVRTDRSTMTQAAFATLVAAFPDGCDAGGCDLDFTYDARRRGYVSVDGPGAFTIDAGSTSSAYDSEWKYVPIRRFATK